MRGGWFVHGADNLVGGPFVAAYVFPTVGWRWLSVGPRLSAGFREESGGPSSTLLAIDYLIGRLTFDW